MKETKHKETSVELDAVATSQQMKTHAMVTGGGSSFSRYQNVVVGKRSLWSSINYEWCVWVGVIPGAIGLLMRKILWPRILGSCGKEVAFGRNIVIRHPHRVHLGARVVISEGCILDARNEGSSKVIVLGDDVILSNNVMISCKGGTVEVSDRTGISAQTIIHSAHNNKVFIGADSIVGPRCYIVGGGNYNIEREDIPIWRQGIKYDGGVRLGNDVWLGANVTVLGGVTMGTGSVAAAGAVVTKDVPTKSICAGIPAKVLKTRGRKELDS